MHCHKALYMLYFYFVDCLQTLIKMHIFLHIYTIFSKNSHLLILISIYNEEGNINMAAHVPLSIFYC